MRWTTIIVKSNAITLIEFSSYVGLMTSLPYHAVSQQMLLTTSLSRRITKLLCELTSMSVLVGPNTRTETYTGSVVCCPLVSHVQCATHSIKVRNTGQTDGRTPDRHITLTARRSQRNNYWLIDVHDDGIYFVYYWLMLFWRMIFFFTLSPSLLLSTRPVP